MRLADEDREEFQLAGTVAWDATQQDVGCDWKPSVPSGFVVYLQVVDGDVKRVGQAADTKHSTYKRRMEDEFRLARSIIRGPTPGRPLAGWRLRPYDTFKKYAAPVLLAGHTVELWAKKVADRPTMDNEEDRLLVKYRGEWTAEGWKGGERWFAEGE